jgi:hypothetical protein
MKMVAAITGFAIVFVVLWDAFETIILPRRVKRKFRLTRLYYLSTWRLWSALARSFPRWKRREAYLSFFGPLSLLFLLVLWAAGLIAGFSLLHWAAGDAADLGTSLYFSGTNFFTLGLGDITPRTPVAKLLTVSEAGTGFAFLAIMIGYLPVIYQAFSRREINISLLDARAGSPPAAGELLRRHANEQGMEALRQLLHEWERWSAELLESHLSYPVLAYFRSQHNNQSWVAALTTILDVCALVMAGLEGACGCQAKLTFAMARHAVVDLAQIFSAPPRKPEHDRLPPADLERLRHDLSSVGLQLAKGPETDQRLRELRRMYEPYVGALSRRLLLPLPPWIKPPAQRDNWETSGWDSILRAQREESPALGDEEHF